MRVRLPRHPHTGRALRLTFTGTDSAPASALGANIDALLEPPKRAGGSSCRSDIALTEQNHPGYIELFLQHPVDPMHRHTFTVHVVTPRLGKAGRWLVCVWEYDNDGTSTTSDPASHAFKRMIVTRRRHRASSSGSFPCRWSWSLYDGMRKGLVTAGSNADCSGQTGSLTLSDRLLRLDPATNVWRTVKAKTKIFRHLNGRRFVEIASPCAAASFRGVFHWTLRNSAHRVTARHQVKTKKLVVTSPNCVLMFSGPGTPLKPM
ncbi:MAG TPA: hypothetical protein VH817_11595 [Thermoleophilaceae bacterium]